MKESKIENLMNFQNRFVGLEFENPIVDKEGNPLSYDQMQKVWQSFQDFDWELDYDELEKISGVQKNFSGNTISLILDNGAGNLELAMPPKENVIEAEKLYKEIIADITKVVRKQGFLFLGTGLLPGKIINTDNTRAHNILYQALEACGSDYYHNGLMLANSAHQVGVSIHLNEAIKIANELIKITGLIVALVANSTIHDWQILPWKEWRIISWDFRFLSNRPGFEILSGFPKRPFTSIADYFHYYWNIPNMIMPPIRDGHWIIPQEKMNFEQYIKSKNISAKDLKGNLVKLIPETKDINLAMICMWPHAKMHIVADPNKITIDDFMVHYDKDDLENYLQDKIVNCYIEYRGGAASPPGEEMALPAFILGLVENISEVEEITQKYSWEQWRELVYSAAFQGFDARINGQNIISLVEELVESSQEGLVKRQMEEQKYLLPIKKRLAERKNPADLARLAFSQSKEVFLSEFSYQ